jgi:hypothetical protein
MSRTSCLTLEKFPSRTTSLSDQQKSISQDSTMKCLWACNEYRNEGVYRIIVLPFRANEYRNEYSNCQQSDVDQGPTEL